MIYSTINNLNSIFMSSGADMISACCCFPVQGTKLSGIVECERHEKGIMDPGKWGGGRCGILTKSGLFSLFSLMHRAF